MNNQDSTTVVQINNQINVIPTNQYMDDSKIRIPFDVESELNQYSRVFVSREFNFYRNFHCFEMFGRDYRVFGELPDRDKKLLFTIQPHFECCTCNFCSIGCFCCEYACCDHIVYQLEYKRNNYNFYTHGRNRRKGCHFAFNPCCCQFFGDSCSIFFGSSFTNICRCKYRLYLRENVDPNNPRIDVGVRKGHTEGTPCCCPFVRDREASYIYQEGNKGHSVKMGCFDACRLLCSKYYCCNCKDIVMPIVDANGNKVGNINVPDGCYSDRVEGKFCYLPGRHYEIDLPPQISSFEKFHIIADVIHFDWENNII